LKAIILAAGVGSRLRPITSSIPKTLVKVNEKPILQRMLDNLVEINIKEIVICVGYQSEKIAVFCKKHYPDLSITFIDNPDFDTTNNMYSLYLARTHLNDDLVLMNGDIVCSIEILKSMLNTQESCFATDVGSYLEESMKLIVQDGTIRAISKSISQEDAYGCSIDLYRFNQKDSFLLCKHLEEIIETKQDRTQWTEVLFDQLLQSGDLHAIPCPTKGAKWFEIDNFTDLAQAELLFNPHLATLKSKQIFFVDRDGTLTLGKKVLEGSLDFISTLKAMGKNVVILTNNSSKTPAQHLESLTNFGLPLEETNVLVSTQIALEYFHSKKISKVFWVANPTVSNYLENEGLTYSESTPEAILLTYDDSLCYSKLVKTTRLIQKGVPYFATHRDIICPTEDGPIPDIGSFIALLEKAAGVSPIKTFGKPSLDMILPTLKQRGYSLREAVVIGDRLYTDIQMAEGNELMSILVMSGETSRAQYESQGTKADILVSSIADLSPFLQ